MNTDQIQSAARSVLKVFGTWLVTKGITTDANVETAIGGLIAMAGIAWSFYHHKTPTK